MGDTFNFYDYSENGKAGRAKSDVAIVGAPFDLGASYHPGQRMGPDAIRAASVWPDGMGHISDGIDANDMTIVDCGNVDITPGDFTGGLEAVRKQIATVHGNSRFVITLGGDHSVSAKAVQAISTATGGPITIFHYDAHGDYEKHDKGVEFNHGTWVRWCIENGYANRVVQFGVRGFGYSKTDLHWAEKNDITTYKAWEANIMEKLDRELADTSDPIYLSVDIDVLDPAHAPGVSHPEPGGMTSRELLRHIDKVVSDEKTVAMDVMEVIPERDVSDLTVKIANRCVAQTLYALARTRH